MVTPSRFEVVRQDFERGIKEVELLLALDPADGDSASGEDAPSEAQNSEGVAVRRAAVVLVVSHFEGFLKNLAEDLTDVFNTGEFPASSLPQPLREIHIVPKLAEIVAARNATQKFALMKKLDDVAALWKSQAKPSAGTLDSSTVARLITNAQRDCIDTLFSTFGELNAVCAGDVEVWNFSSERFEPDNIENRLLDVVRCRNDIAHGDAERRPTADDVQRYVTFFSALSKRLSIKAEQIEDGVKAQQA